MTGVIATAGQSIPGVDAETEAWLRDLLAHLDPVQHVVGHVEGDPSPLRRSADGVWRAGDVIGEIRFAGRRLSIRPADTDFDPKATAALTVAAIWCRSFEEATRHGPPAIHTEIPHVGGSMRGNLDVRSTVRLRARGSSSVASVYRARDLRNPLSCAIVAADRALTRQIGDDRWQTKRVRELLPRLHDAVGRRGAVPTLVELSRIRYSPITRPFRDVAELSVRIVEQDPLVTSTKLDYPQGLLAPFSP